MGEGGGGEERSGGRWGRQGGREAERNGVKRGGEWGEER